ncbi:MAG: S1/P1 Nuclease [Vulcanimicrobiaceae bacterium]
MRFHPSLAFLCAAVLLAAPLPAGAWGAQGHEIINGAAIAALPASVPAFLRGPAAHDEVELLGPEPDRMKGSGAPLDDDASPGHYVDAQDDDTIDGIPLSALPKDRRAYDSALRAAPEPSDQYSQGYLPYSIADGWEQLVRDFAYWRVDTVGATKAPTEAGRAFFAYDRSVREAVTLHDIGVWGHFVGDASQPLHVTVHFNGWNSARTHYPNPAGFSDSHTVHARWETDLVRAVATEPLVLARVPAVATSDAPILAQVGAYLTTTESFVPAVYKLEAAGGIDGRSPAATSLVLDRLAAGAAEMRNLIVEAWVASDDQKIGYPGIPVHDIESGAVVPTRAGVGLGD